MRFQSVQDLKQEMLSVARGDLSAPPDAALPSFQSREAFMRLLTTDARLLLSTIEQAQPASVADLATLVERTEANVRRTLDKLVAFGFVRLRPGDGNIQIPEVAIHF